MVRIFNILFFILFLSLKMSAELVGRLAIRDHLLELTKDSNEWILEHCFYCKKCRPCSINSRLHKELTRNSFKTTKKHIKCWWIN